LHINQFVNKQKKKTATPKELQPNYLVVYIIKGKLSI